MGMQDHINVARSFYFLSDEEMQKIEGGISISGTLINAYSKIMDVFLEIGRSFGTALRRMFSGDICPLD